MFIVNCIYTTREIMGMLLQRWGGGGHLTVFNIFFLFSPAHDVVVEDVDELVELDEPAAVLVDLQEQILTKNILILA